MHGYSLGMVKARGLIMALAALMLVALGAAGGVARSDPAPSIDLNLKATPDKIRYEERQPQRLQVLPQVLAEEGR